MTKYTGTQCAEISKKIAKWVFSAQISHEGETDRQTETERLSEREREKRERVLGFSSPVNRTGSPYDESHIQNYPTPVRNTITKLHGNDWLTVLQEKI